MLSNGAAHAADVWEQNIGPEGPIQGGRAMEPKDRVKEELERLEVVAGNGLLDRRAFLRSGAAFAAAVTSYTVVRSAGGAPLQDEPRGLVPCAAFPSHAQRAPVVVKVLRPRCTP